MPGTLRLTRAGTGIELRRAPFQITLDGRTVATLEHGDTVDLPLDSGSHTLRVLSGRYTSRLHTFSSTEGEVVRFRCHSAMMWPRYVASVLKPDLAISLRRE